MKSIENFILFYLCGIDGTIEERSCDKSLVATPFSE